MNITIRRLGLDDEVETFRCGNADLDRFFARYAARNQFRHHIGTTYVAVDDAGMILGFATVAAAEVAPARLPAPKRRPKAPGRARLPRYPLPALRLARLAVDLRAQGRGVGNLLLRGVFVLARRLADEIGCVGVVVDAKPDAVAFYERLGFAPLEAVAGELGDRPQPLPMFLELGAIADPK